MIALVPSFAVNRGSAPFSDQQTHHRVLTALAASMYGVAPT